MRFWPKAIRLALVVSLVIEAAFLPLKSAYAAPAKAYDQAPEEDSTPTDPSDDIPENATIVFEQTENKAQTDELMPGAQPILQEPTPQELETQEKQAALIAAKETQWAENKDEILGELLDLNYEVHELANTFKKKFGAKRLDELVEKKEVFKEHEGFGKALMTKCDGQYIVRIIHEPSQTAFLLLPKKAKTYSPNRGIDPNSTHLRQLVARQHIEAKDVGLDVVKVWMAGDRVMYDQYEPKDEASYWKEYAYAKYKKPVESDYTMGLVVGMGLQGALMTLATALRAHIDPTHPFTWYPVALTMAFGLPLGIFSSTYRNITQTGTPSQIALKSSVVSVLFSYLLVAGTHHLGFIEGVRSFNPIQWPSAGWPTDDPFSILNSAALLKHLTLGVNAYTSNRAKDFWYRITRFREKLRENTKIFKPKILFWTPERGLHKLKVDTGWNQASFENQMIYLIPWTLNILQLMGMAFGDFYGFKFPTWHILSILPAQYILMKYAAYMAEKKATDPAALSKKQVQAFAEEKRADFEGNYPTILKAGRFAQRQVEKIPGVAALSHAVANTCEGLFNKITEKRK
jgi:hypothetical protein